MTEFLSPLDGGERFVLSLVSVVMVTTMVIPIASVGLAHWRKVREREAAAALVHDMLAKGFSIEEIERVLTGMGFSKPSHQDIDQVRKNSFWSCR